MNLATISTDDQDDNSDFNLDIMAKYQCVDLLGKGAFSQVVRAIDLSDNQEYAIKSVLNLIMNEANILKSLEHPNIVKFKEILQTPDKAYIVMECMNGGSLKRLIEQHKQNKIWFTDEEASIIIKSVAKAICYTHSKNIIHRDLKPDFGLSAQFETEKNIRSFSDKCGTMIYMAPELAKKNKYSKPVDIWSIGIIMYILLNKGKHPLIESNDKNSNAFLDRLQNPQWKIPENMNKLAQDLFFKLIKNIPSERYTAHQILEHPWITRAEKGSIPLTLDEMMKNFHVAQTFIRITKALYFLNKIKSQTSNIAIIQNKFGNSNSNSSNQGITINQGNTKRDSTAYLSKPNRKSFKISQPIMNKKNMVMQQQQNSAKTTTDETQLSLENEVQAVNSLQRFSTEKIQLTFQMKSPLGTSISFQKNSKSTNNLQLVEDFMNKKQNQKKEIPLIKILSPQKQIQPQRVGILSANTSNSKKYRLSVDLQSPIGTESSPLPKKISGKSKSRSDIRLGTSPLRAEIKDYSKRIEKSNLLQLFDPKQNIDKNRISPLKSFLQANLNSTNDYNRTNSQQIVQQFVKIGKSSQKSLRRKAYNITVKSSQSSTNIREELNDQKRNGKFVKSRYAEMTYSSKIKVKQKSEIKDPQARLYFLPAILQSK